MIKGKYSSTYLRQVGLWISIFFLSFIFQSCKTTGVDDQVEDEANLGLQEMLTDPSDMALAVMEQIPTSFEISSIIKSTGAAFREDLLHDPEKVKSYVSSSQRALNFGVYGADLGYAHIYGSRSKTADELKAIADLSMELNLSHLFDFELMQQLVIHGQDLDSLVRLSTHSFEEINNHLAITQRGDLGAMIIVGGWIEALYLTCEVNKSNQNQVLATEIASQGKSLSLLLEMVGQFPHHHQIKDIKGKLEMLKALYGQIKVKTVENQDSDKEKDGIPMFEEKQAVSFQMPDSTLGQIGVLVSKLRGQIIK